MLESKRQPVLLRLSTASEMRFPASILASIVWISCCSAQISAQPDAVDNSAPLLVPPPAAAPVPQAITTTESGNQPEVVPSVIEVPRTDLNDYEFVQSGRPLFSNGQKEYPTLEWGGFLQLDTGWIIQDQATVDAVGKVNTETGLRRVRLRASGNVRKETSYVIDLDFAASGHPSFRDVAVIFSGAKFVDHVEAGYFKQPFGMDAESSGRELLFMERQLPFAFAPFRQTGLRSFGTFPNENGTYAFSAFKTPTDSYGVSSGNNGGWAFATRETVLLVNNDDVLVHLGGGYSFGNPANNRVRYAVQPGFFVSDPSDNSATGIPAFVDTGNIPTDNFHLFNLELASQYGPFRTQAEYRWSIVNRPNMDPVNFSGGYFQAGLLLTGESAVYNRKRGIFSGVIPDEELGDCGIGAFELTAGWAIIDLNDLDVQGGRMQTLTFGLNWYLNSYARVIFNMIPVKLDAPTVGRADSLVLSGRLQLEF